MPIHWNDQYAAHARVDSLIHPVMDSLSGQPESKHTPVKAQPLRALWQGVLLSRTELKSLPCEYWTKIPMSYGYRYELADRQLPENWQDWIAQLVDVNEDTVQLSSGNGELLRIATFKEGVLDCLFMAATDQLRPNHQWLADQFAAGVLDDAARQGLLSGRAVDPGEDIGAIICSCFQVGENSIKAAIGEGYDNPESLAEKLKCGSNCGSCIPEIKTLVAENKAAS